MVVEVMTAVGRECVACRQCPASRPSVRPSVVSLLLIIMSPAARPRAGLSRSRRKLIDISHAVMQFVALMGRVNY